MYKSHRYGVEFRVMLPSYTLFFIVFSIAAASAQQTSPRTAAADQPTVEQDLIVVADIVRQSYCRADDEAFSVKMNIRLRFTNKSAHPVILARNIESPPIIRVAKNSRDAQNGDFEYAPIVDHFPSSLPSSPSFGDSPDKQYFITLAPQQSYEATVVSGVFGAEHAAKGGKGTGLVPKGNHLLQLGVDTWPYQWPYFTNPFSAKQLSERWKAYGHLASGWVYSDFVPLAIPEQFDNTPCETPKS
jgi:hypothetical protein